MITIETAINTIADALVNSVSNKILSVMDVINLLGIKADRLVIVDKADNQKTRKLYIIKEYDSNRSTFKVTDCRMPGTFDNEKILSIEELKDHLIVPIVNELGTVSFVELECSDCLYYSSHRYNVAKGLMSNEDTLLNTVIEVIAFNNIFNEYQTFNLVVRNEITNYDEIIGHFISILPSYLTNTGKDITCSVKIPEVKVVSTFKVVKLEHKAETIDMFITEDNDKLETVFNLNDIFRLKQRHAMAIKQRKPQVKRSVNKVPHKGSNHAKSHKKALG